MPERHRVNGNALVSRPSARVGAPFFARDAGLRARAGTQGPHDVRRPLRFWVHASRVYPTCAHLSADLGQARDRCLADFTLGPRKARTRGLARDTRAEHARGGAFLPTVPACRVPPIASVGRSRYIGGRLLRLPGRVSHARGTAEYRRRDQAVGRAAEEASLTSTRRARAWRTSTSRRRIPRSGTTSSARSG
jgi:hypothetical protein